MNGTTPSGLTPGAPAGSLRLKRLRKRHLYNGNLNFHLPLLPVGGRGGAGYAIHVASIIRIGTFGQLRILIRC